jgi:hypothetical protein
MYFITTDAEGFITGVYDGSKDYVHRVTGEPIEGVVQVPEGAFLIGDVCLDILRFSPSTHKPRWDSVSGCMVSEPVTSIDEKRKVLCRELPVKAGDVELARVKALSDEEVESEWGSL